MKLVELECKNCGGYLKVEEGTDIVKCPYCGASYKIHEEDMEKSGYEFEKGRIKAQKEHLNSTMSDVPPAFPKVMLIPIILIIAIIVIVSIVGITSNRKQSGEHGEKPDVSVEEFNLYYDNGRQYGSFVENDMSKIIDSNKKYENKKITVKYEDKETSDPEEIAEIKKSLDLSIYYEITLDYDKDGYVNLYTIEKASKTPDEIEYEASRFNMYYHSGTIRGGTVAFQLKSVIESNKANEERKITVKYNDTETDDPDEIEKIKGKLETFTDYEVTLEYDSEGFICVFNIQ